MGSRHLIPIMKLHLSILAISSQVLANDIFTDQNNAKSVLNHRSKRAGHNLEADCFEKEEYCRWWMELREGGENDPSLQEYFSKSGSKYEETKKAHKVYSKCHRADKQCRKQGNLCACNYRIRQFLGLSIDGVDPKNCPRHCFRVPNYQLKDTGCFDRDLQVCHSCGYFTFNDGQHDWKKLAGDTNYDDIVCTTTDSSNTEDGLESFKMGSQSSNNTISGRDNACMKAAFEWGDKEVSLPRGGLGKMTSWTACMAFCGTTELFVPEAKFDPECRNYCEALSLNSAGVCDGDVFCNEICMLNEDLWSDRGEKRCQLTCKSSCTVFKLMRIQSVGLG